MPFLNKLKTWFAPKKPKRSTLLAPLVDPRFEHPAYKNIPPELLAAVGNPAGLRYPPYDEGYYGLISGEFCMSRFQEKLFHKLKRQSGVSPEEYRCYLKPILIAYAELVHLLPASQHHHHHYPGGLLRHGLETACFMLDWMVLTKFDHELTPGEASKRLRRWYVAGIISALFHDAGKPLTDVRVMSFEGDQEWHMGTMTIHEWAVANNISRYFITWIKDRCDRHTSHTPWLIGRFVSGEIEQWLIEGGEDIWQALLDAATGQPGPLTRAVKIADSRSVKADRERAGHALGEADASVSVERLCVDAMRFLLDEKLWTCNESGSRLWLTTEGVFLAWGHGSGEIIQQVVKNQASNFPRAEQSLLAAMEQHELIERGADGSLIWHVAPHVLFKNGKGPSLRCVKLQHPDELFPGGLNRLRPISATIGRGEDAQEYLAPADTALHSEAQSNAGEMLTSPSEKQPGPAQYPAAEAHVEKTIRPSVPLLVPPAFTDRLSNEDADYLRSNSALASRLLTDWERNPRIRELQNRTFLPLNGLITEADLPALTEGGWLWPNLASNNGELTRIQRGETGVMLNTRLSLIFCRLTNAKWQPRCHATLPEELHSQVIRRAFDLVPHALEERGRGATAYSLSFWARDKFQTTNGLSSEETERAILYGLEAVKISNERKYYFSAGIELQL
jgi:conjugal transfer pilus assembly protein TraI